MNVGERPASPLSGISLEGYAEEVSVRAGSTARFMLSSTAGDPAQVQLLRLRHGDPNPQGPGLKTDEPHWAPRKDRVAVPRQIADYGSYLEIPDSPALRSPPSFAVVMWFFPTLLHGGWQTLAAKGFNGEFSYALYCGGHRLLTAAVSHDGRRVEWCAGAAYVQPRAWQCVALTYAAETGDLAVWQGAAEGARGHAGPATADDGWTASKRTLAPGRLHAGSAPLLFGASERAPGAPHWAHFNGKLARPLLLGAAIGPKELTALAAGGDPADLAPVLGRWDLSRSVTNAIVADVSGKRNDGLAVNAPGRAVTGPSWSGTPASLFTQKPELYDAIHLHDDDLDDARWDPTVELDIPADARSGIYALRVSAGHDEIHVPIVVRPHRPPTGDIAVLMPTLTWQAYASNQFPWSFGEDGFLDRGVCLYNAHSDGSEVYYATRRRPTRAWSPSQGVRLWGAHLVTAALYLVDWLEQKAIAYDALTDEDLHLEGAALLSRYRCLVLGSHPEYWTGAMLRALGDFTRSGGRVLYLGGNGLYWVTSIDQERPFLMEVRKSGEGSYDERWIKPQAGEYQHSTSLEVGGMWARRGYPPRSMVGVEHAANVFGSMTERWGFRRLDASRQERFAFVFENVESDVIGDFGLNLGSAAGYEMDRAQEWCTPVDAELVVLARATHPTFVPPKRLPVEPAADMALLLLAGGGAVFAAGSVTWTGSLSHNDYDNNVSTVTENVLRRFCQRPTGDAVA